MFVTLSGTLAVIPHSQYVFVPVAFLAGVLADLLTAALRPVESKGGAARVFAFVVPSATFALYFVALVMSGGIGWSVHLWTGSIAIAVVMGLLLSYVAVPPDMPAPSLLNGARP